MPFIPDNTALQSMLNQIFQQQSTMFSGPLDAMLKAKQDEQGRAADMMKLFADTVGRNRPDLVAAAMGQPGVLEGLTQQPSILPPRQPKLPKGAVGPVQPIDRRTPSQRVSGAIGAVAGQPAPPTHEELSLNHMIAKDYVDLSEAYGGALPFTNEQYQNAVKSGSVDTLLTPALMNKVVANKEQSKLPDKYRLYQTMLKDPRFAAMEQQKPGTVANLVFGDSEKDAMIGDLRQQVLQGTLDKMAYEKQNQGKVSEQTALEMQKMLNEFSADLSSSQKQYDDALAMKDQESKMRSAAAAQGQPYSLPVTITDERLKYLGDKLETSKQIVARTRELLKSAGIKGQEGSVVLPEAPAKPGYRPPPGAELTLRERQQAEAEGAGGGKPAPAAAATGGLTAEESAFAEEQKRTMGTIWADKFDSLPLASKRRLLKQMRGQ